MKDTMRIALLAGMAASALLMAAPASAEEEKAFYVAISAGINSGQDTEIR